MSAQAPKNAQEKKRVHLQRTTRILLVDDLTTMRRILRKMLTDIGLTNIVEAEDGMKAWDILQHDTVEFIVSDWTMPNMNGLELLQKVRASEEFCHLPFLMVTAEANQEYVLQAVEAGVSNYIVKPFNEQTFMRKLESIFRLRKGALDRTDGQIVRMKP